MGCIVGRDKGTHILIGFAEPSAQPKWKGLLRDARRGRASEQESTARPSRDQPRQDEAGRGRAFEQESPARPSRPNLPKPAAPKSNERFHVSGRLMTRISLSLNLRFL